MQTCEYKPKGSCTYEGPEAGEHLAHNSRSKGAGVAGAEDQGEEKGVKPERKKERGHRGPLRLGLWALLQGRCRVLQCSERRSTET